MFHLLSVMLRTCPPQAIAVPATSGEPAERLRPSNHRTLRCAHPLSAHAKVWNHLQGEQQPSRPAGNDHVHDWSRRSQPRHR